MFDRWTLQGDGRLTTDGVDIQLPPKEWHVLRLLLACPDLLVTKDRLLALVWPNGEVAEESLTRCICSLRKYLKGARSMITTVYGQGYRFNGPVRVLDKNGPLEGAANCPGCGLIIRGVTSSEEGFCAGIVIDCAGRIQRGPGLLLARGRQPA
ncbi:winged helix-turn-helix domain-containing protein [Pseudomonas mucidolens]|uniref:winged helix-turn-helix domain-containing protein n=1 Tax=Pseudomonas mucidolens TaxID=46679 RepID=UPI0038CDA978